ncbi:CPBP family glutamic-type intramembrane protease [Limosilactobacillus reuteri]|nr:CPBP family glutamic-type intramembrane protease [Limosilactobacillus reuteri]
MNNWWLQFTMTVVSAPLVEEYVFRGYVFGALDSTIALQRFG